MCKKSGFPAGLVKTRRVFEESNGTHKITNKEPRQIRSELAFATAEVKHWLFSEGSMGASRNNNNIFESTPKFVGHRFFASVAVVKPLPLFEGHKGRAFNVKRS